MDLKKSKASPLNYRLQFTNVFKRCNKKNAQYKYGYCAYVYIRQHFEGVVK